MSAPHRPWSVGRRLEAVAAAGRDLPPHLLLGLACPATVIACKGPHCIAVLSRQCAGSRVPRTHSACPGIARPALPSSRCSFLMGVLGNMPLGIAPGMGLNAYFAYQAGV